MLILIPCPECGLRAEVTDRFWLTGTDGPVEHLALRCSARRPAPSWKPGMAAGTAVTSSDVSDGDRIAVMPPDGSIEIRDRQKDIINLRRRNHLHHRGGEHHLPPPRRARVRRGRGLRR